MTSQTAFTVFTYMFCTVFCTAPQLIPVTLMQVWRRCVFCLFFWYDITVDRFFALMHR